MTKYGLNPSFATWTSRLPLFANPIRRGRAFEPTDRDDRIQVRVFGDMGGTMPALSVRPERGEVWQHPGEAAIVVGKDQNELEGTLMPLTPAVSGFHRPSLEALAALRPTVLRTLDWSQANKRPDWAQRRTMVSSVLQGTDRGMAVELQATAANLLGCNLWWNAPPRFDLSEDRYKQELRLRLAAIKGVTRQRYVVLEYGNELWNDGFPVRDWLASLGQSWHEPAAREIELLVDAAEAEEIPYYLFVGGQLTVPSHLDRLLAALAGRGVVPDGAGPALYVTPLKAHLEEWEATKAVPSQDELRASCFARLDQLGPYLRRHREILDHHGVPILACYEAGQSLIAGSHPWRRAAIEAQRTEWMGDLYRGIRALAEREGVDFLNWYSAATDQEPNDPRVDVFGLLESTDLSKMLPKARAARGE